MSKQSKMTGADYLLLLLYLDNCSAINGAIRITKMMFLFNMEIAPVLKKKGVSIRDEDLPKFSAYNYGPFSKDVYEQVELFQSIGFIKVKNLYTCISNGVGLIFYDTELNEFFIEVEASKTADVWEKERCRIVNYLEAKRDEATTSKNS